ncbi:hypothetical protein ACXDIV_005795 [Klebsiella variicola]
MKQLEDESRSVAKQLLADVQENIRSPQADITIEPSHVNFA